MIIGFTGTRKTWTRLQESRLILELEAVEFASEFHHGDCVGSDERAHNIVRVLWPRVRIHSHPPTIEKQRAFCIASVYYEPKPYLERNRDIVDACDLLIATPATNQELQRSGTWATVRHAWKTNKENTVILPNGGIL